jgi:hypothetical protein
VSPGTDDRVLLTGKTLEQTHRMAKLEQHVSGTYLKLVFRVLTYNTDIDDGFQHNPNVASNNGIAVLYVSRPGISK